MEQPPKWTKDHLSEFLDIGFNNIFASFHNHKDKYALLSEIDNIFHSMTGNFINTDKITPALLFMRSHSSYRAACQLVLATQIPESYTLARSCLEYALYALHINKSVEVEKKWIHRHDDEASKSKCRAEFSYGNVLKTLKIEDINLASEASNLYEGYIDHGGHPNEKAVTNALQVPETEKGFELKQLYYQGDCPQLISGMRNIKSAGLCALYIFRLIWKERFDITGATGRLDKIRNHT